MPFNDSYYWTMILDIFICINLAYSNNKHGNNNNCTKQEEEVRVENLIIEYPQSIRPSLRDLHVWYSIHTNLGSMYPYKWAFEKFICHDYWTYKWEPCHTGSDFLTPSSCSFHLLIWFQMNAFRWFFSLNRQSDSLFLFVFSVSVEWMSSIQEGSDYEITLFLEKVKFAVMRFL